MTGALQLKRATDTAASGFSGDGGAIPHAAAIQQSFGPGHDVSSIRAHADEHASAAAGALGAEAYAMGDSVAFAGAPSLHTAAHEAAHVIQQRHGVDVQGVGEAGDRYEQNADAVADRVVRGESATDLLPQGGGGGSQAIQRKVVKTQNEEATEYYATPEEATEALLLRFPFIAQYYKDSKDLIDLAIGALFGDGLDHTIEQVGEAITPNLLVGESHQDEGARDFVVQNLDDMITCGIRAVVIELPDAPDCGELVKYLVNADLYPEAGNLQNATLAMNGLADTATLEQCVDFLAGNALLHPVLRKAIIQLGNTGGASGGKGEGLANLAIEAKGRGMAIRLGDSDLGFGVSRTDTSGMRARDQGFARIIHAANQQVGKAVTVVGANHLGSHAHRIGPRLASAHGAQSWESKLG